MKKGIRDKENPLKVAQSRLEARTHRPDMELCRDPPHHRIVEEVGQIQESVVSSFQSCFFLISNLKVVRKFDVFSKSGVDSVYCHFDHFNKFGLFLTIFGHFRYFLAISKTNGLLTTDS